MVLVRISRTAQGGVGEGPRGLQLLGQNSPLRLLRGRRVVLERRAGNDPDVYGFASLGDPDDLLMSDFLVLRICG